MLQFPPNPSPGEMFQGWTFDGAMWKRGVVSVMTGSIPAPFEVTTPGIRVIEIATDAAGHCGPYSWDVGLNMLAAIEGHAPGLHFNTDGSGWCGFDAIRSLHWSNSGDLEVPGAHFNADGTGSIGNLTWDTAGDIAGAGVNALLQLLDVAITSPANNQCLRYRSSDGKWYNGVAGVTSVAVGTGLTGGTITTAGTIALATSGVTARTYQFATIAVDAYGRVTFASDGVGAPPAGNYLFDEDTRETLIDLREEGKLMVLGAEANPVLVLNGGKWIQHEPEYEGDEPIEFRDFSGRIGPMAWQGDGFTRFPMDADRRVEIGRHEFMIVEYLPSPPGQPPHRHVFFGINADGDIEAAAFALHKDGSGHIGKLYWTAAGDVTYDGKPLG
jgi:hypothetical protein